MAASKAVFACLVISLAAAVSAKPGFYAQPSHGAHIRPRYQVEEDNLLRAARESDDYEDFPMVPPLLRLSFNVPEEEYFKSPGKRYLGIDIPDYISTGGKADAIKSMSNKMKAMGRK